MSSSPGLDIVNTWSPLSDLATDPFSLETLETKSLCAKSTNLDWTISSKSVPFCVDFSFNSFVVSSIPSAVVSSVTCLDISSIFLLNESPN